MKKSCPNLFPLVVSLLLIPFFLHRKWRVVRRIIIHAKSKEIFPYLNDLQNWPLWTEWAMRDDVHYSYGDVKAGVGAVQNWETRRMSGTMKIIQSVQDERVVYDLDLNHGKCRLEGVLSLEEIDGSTRVTWLCKWESGPNPYRRYLDVVYKLLLKRDFQLGLENLRDLVGNRQQA
ncbi:MAG: SRPBCC family protein [Verrucomicrobiota bacterium]